MNDKSVNKGYFINFVCTLFICCKTSYFISLDKFVIFKEGGIDLRLFDAHFHIINFDYPVSENQGYMPPSFTVKDYYKAIESIHMKGGAIVSGSFQGFDQGYLINALQQISPSFCGVTQLPYTVSDQEIVSLHDKGVRALRFNIKRGGSEDISKLDSFARRVYDLVGWHCELYIDADALMFGTDLPSTRAERPFDMEDKVLIQHLFDEQASDKILYSNAVKWYFK